MGPAKQCARGIESLHVQPGIMHSSTYRISVAIECGSDG